MPEAFEENLVSEDNGAGRKRKMTRRKVWGIWDKRLKGWYDFGMSLYGNFQFFEDKKQFECLIAGKQDYYIVRSCYLPKPLAKRKPKSILVAQCVSDPTPMRKRKKR